MDKALTVGAAAKVVRPRKPFDGWRVRLLEHDRVLGLWWACYCPPGGCQDVPPWPDCQANTPKNKKDYPRIQLPHGQLQLLP